MDGAFALSVPAVQNLNIISIASHRKVAITKNIYFENVTLA